MAKLLKIGNSALSIFLDFFLLLLIVSVFSIRMPVFQTFLAHKASEWLSKELNTVVNIEKLDIAFFNHAYVSGIYVEDLDHDTLAYLGQIELDINDFSWSLEDIEVDQFTISDGKINLIKKLGQEDFNYAFIEDYFASDEPREPKTGKGPKIHINQFNINDVDFKYMLEYRKDYAHGINFNKLDLRKMNLFIEDFTIYDEQFTGKIASLSARENSGFDLQKLSADFDLSAEQLKLKQAKIETEKSLIQIPELTFVTKTWDSYNYFEDSVYMDIRLEKTIASMEDIAYFATDLWGMNQEVFLSGRVKDYVYNLKIQDLYLETGRETILRGNFELPDFRKESYSIPLQQVAFLQSSYRDLQNFRLPSEDSEEFLEFPTDVHTQRILNEAGLVQIKRLALKGEPERFDVMIDLIESDLGKVSARNGIEFYEDESGTLNYRPDGEGIYLSNVDLSKISGEDVIGLTTGFVHFEGRGISDTDISFNAINGSFEFIEINGRPYKNLDFTNASVTTTEFLGKVRLNDDLVQVEFDGAVRFDSSEEIKGLMQIDHINFDKIGLSGLKDVYPLGTIEVDLKGFGGETLEGTLKTQNLNLKKDSTSFTFDNLSLQIDRSGPQDALYINSDVLSGKVEGILDFEQISKAVQYQASTILPLILPNEGNEDFVYKDYASFEFTITDMNSLLQVILPSFSIESGSLLNGSMNGRTKKYDFDLTSQRIQFGEQVFTGIKLANHIDSNGIDAKYTVARFNYNDSLFYDNLEFTSSGSNSSFLSKLTWGEENFEGGELNWLTNVNNKSDIAIDLKACHFYIESQRWSLDNFEELSISPGMNFKDGKVLIHDFMFVNGLQYISIDGMISENPLDALAIQISDFDVEIFNKLNLDENKVSGLVSGNFAVHNVLKDIYMEGTLSVDDFTLNDHYIGIVDLESSFEDAENELKINGSIYNANIAKNKLNTFSGDYTLSQTINGVSTPDQLDFIFNFATMDVSFADAFVDEKIASDIQGLVEGKLVIKGSSEKPLVSGRLDMKDGQAKIGLLGTTYKVQGPINITNYGLSMVNMPIKDEENNAAILSASVFHENFKKWDYNVFLDLTRDGVKKDPLNKNIPAKLDRFLALNTVYKEGEIYYGKGYVTGNVNIYGTDELVEITANLASARGTEINFPMYGKGEISEDEFVVFINNKDTSKLVQDTKIDFSGVRLNLNIDATTDANLRIIFNEATGDEISAKGKGRFNINLDELNDVTMTGTFEVAEGEYNFALGVVKKLFRIEPGSTVKWIGDPYEALLNVRTYYLVEANLQDISSLINPDVQGQSQGRDQIYCYLTLKDKLSQPVLEFDIGAPRASDDGRVAINRVRSDYDELTRQFFSLLLMRQFQPLRGSQTAANTKSSNAINELLANQINSALSQISGNYDLRVSKNDDLLANQSTYKVGFASSFLDDRLIISGSFGVNHMKGGSSVQGNSNNLMGDVNIEYKLNRLGTFRVNVFNRSNQNTVIQNYNIGRFTQGAGVYYQESFSGWHDFQLVQSSLDVFRSNGQRKSHRIDGRYLPLPRLSYLDSTKNDTIPLPKEPNTPPKQEAPKPDQQVENEQPAPQKSAAIIEDEDF